MKVVVSKPAPPHARAPRRAARVRPPDVLAILRERIARHEFAPGMKLRESNLALEFGVPRTRIRDAFSVLEQRGLIERVPNRGAVVARLDLAQAFHIYEVREVLEGLAARLATRNTAPASWQDLVDLFEGPMATHVRNADFDAFVAGYERFRQRCIVAAANPVLTQALDGIYEKTQVLIRRIIILPGRAEAGLGEHLAVLHAMRRGDADAAERLRRENMRNAKDVLVHYQKYVL